MSWVSPLFTHAESRRTLNISPEQLPETLLGIPSIFQSFLSILVQFQARKRLLPLGEVRSSSRLSNAPHQRRWMDGNPSRMVYYTWKIVDCSEHESSTTWYHNAAFPTYFPLFPEEFHSEKRTTKIGLIWWWHVLNTHSMEWCRWWCWEPVVTFRGSRLGGAALKSPWKCLTLRFGPWEKGVWPVFRAIYQNSLDSAFIFLFICFNFPPTLATHAHFKRLKTDSSHSRRWNYHVSNEQCRKLTEKTIDWLMETNKANTSTRNRTIGRHNFELNFTNLKTGD